MPIDDGDLIISLSHSVIQTQNPRWMVTDAPVAPAVGLCIALRVLSTCALCSSKHFIALSSFLHCRIEDTVALG